MTWVRKRILVVVKAAPEPSKKYGDCICTAGITDEGEWMRLYPVPLGLFRRGKGFRKFDWIEVDCKSASDEEKLGRKESYKIRAETLRVVDRTLSRSTKVDWAGRNAILDPHRSASIEDLTQAYDADRTSLGMIRVGELIDFYKTRDLTDAERETHHAKQMTFGQLNGDAVRLRPEWILKQIPHIFKYRFRCEPNTCPSHDITCEDWELFEAYRKWPETYGTEDRTFEKIKDRFFIKFKAERDLHFFMGMYSMYPSWMIVGLYYPPK